MGRTQFSLRYDEAEFSFKAVDPGTTVHPPFITIMVATTIVILVQALMLYVVLKCREYLSLKHMHDLEVKVAERSVRATASSAH